MKSLFQIGIAHEIVWRHDRKYKLYPMLKRAVRSLNRRGVVSVLVNMPSISNYDEWMAIPITLQQYPGFSGVRMVKKVLRRKDRDNVIKWEPVIVPGKLLADRDGGEKMLRVSINPSWVRWQISGGSHGK